MEARVEPALDEVVEQRLVEELRSALRRKSSHEAQLAGAARTLAPRSALIRDALGDVVSMLAERAAFVRPLYESGIRALAQAGTPSCSELMARLLEREDAGGLATLSAACFDSSSTLAEPLAHVVMRRQPHRAFAAELARIARGESSGVPLTSIAPKIKESHRLQLCAGQLVPLLWDQRTLSRGVGPALEVLRGAERHLGRWLVLGEVATRAGDDSPSRDAQERAQKGAAAAKGAWQLVHWALVSAREPAVAPEIRPTVELIARLSDRPSAERDPTFLFRMAEAQLETARGMLENLSKSHRRCPDVAVRALLYLVKNHDEPSLSSRLVDVARESSREGVRGLAAAALYDVGERELAVELCQPLRASRQIASATWSALVIRAAALADEASLVTEPNFRRVQLGWVD